MERWIPIRMRARSLLIGALVALWIVTLVYLGISCLIREEAFDLDAPSISAQSLETSPAPSILLIVTLVSGLLLLIVSASSLAVPGVADER
jgi:hypothetical protein